MSRQISLLLRFLADEGHDNAGTCSGSWTRLRALILFEALMQHLDYEQMFFMVAQLDGTDPEFADLVSWSTRRTPLTMTFCGLCCRATAIARACATPP